MRREGESADEVKAGGASDFEDDPRAPSADEDEDEPEATDDAGESGRQRGDVSTRVIDSLPGSPQFWSTVCVACLVVSAALVLNGQAEAAFVTATVGVLAWFVNVRNRLRDDDSPTTNSGGRRENGHESNGVRND